MFSVHVTYMPLFALGFVWTRHSVGVVIGCFAIEVEWWEPLS